MDISRRHFVELAAASATLPLISRTGEAEAYPSRPVKWMVGYPAGGTSDIAARLLGQWLADRLGQPFIIENRAGASGNIATEAVAKSPADGYTLLLVNAGSTINETFYEKRSFNLLRDIVGIANIVRTPFVLLVNPSLPVQTVPQFMAYAKANSGKLNIGSAGNGTPHHVCGELFKMMTGTNLVHVPYRGSAPALTDLMGGQVQVMFEAVTASLEYIRDGKLRALAVTTDTPSEVLPKLPCLADFIPGYEAAGWYGVGAPRGTPPAIVDRLNREINAGVTDPNLGSRISALGGTVATGSSSDFDQFIAAEVAKWAKVVRYSGATAS